MPWDETEWAQSGEWGLDAVSAAEVEAPAEDGSRGAPAEDVRGGRRRQEQWPNKKESLKGMDMSA